MWWYWWGVVVVCMCKDEEHQVFKACDDLHAASALLDSTVRYSSNFAITGLCIYDRMSGR